MNILKSYIDSRPWKQQLTKHLRVHLVAVLKLLIISHDLHQHMEFPCCHEIVDFPFIGRITKFVYSNLLVLNPCITQATYNLTSLNKQGQGTAAISRDTGKVLLCTALLGNNKEWRRVQVFQISICEEQTSSGLSFEKGDLGQTKMGALQCQELGKPGNLLLVTKFVGSIL